jgi:hypothetical protein
MFKEDTIEMTGAGVLQRLNKQRVVLCSFKEWK